MNQTPTMKLTPPKSFLLPLLLAGACLTRGQSTFIYDQQSATNRDILGYGITVQPSQPIGQSFTPTLSSIGFVQLEFVDSARSNGIGATVSVDLWAGSIGGTLLGQTDPVFMPDNFSFGITNFFFSTPVALTPGTTYFLQPITEPGSDSNWTIINNVYNYPGEPFISLVRRIRRMTYGSARGLWCRNRPRVYWC